MNEKREYLRQIIREAIQEVRDEDYEWQEKQETLAMKRIQSYAHWGKVNLEKHPDEIPGIFDRIVKEIDGLVEAHDKGEEVSPSNTKDALGQKGYMGYTPPKTKMLEKSPPGWSGTTKAMKKHKEIDNPFALAWYMKKKGDKPHYKPEKKRKS
jgi:hypothetical protein